MKVFALIGFCLVVSSMAFSQDRDKELKSRKLSKEEAAPLTTDQRYVHESNRRGKQGKKKVSLKKKVKIQKQQARSAESIKAPKKAKRRKPKS
jgi:hypothetical protein